MVRSLPVSSTPVLFLAAMGVGLGSLVNRNAGATSHLGGISYLEFIAPGLLAATAMQIAAQESTYPVMGAIKWMRTYHAMLATPLRVIDVLVGHLAWIALRMVLVTTIFVAVMSAFGAAGSPMVVLDIPAGALTGMAFAAPIAAFAATRDNDAAFSPIFRFLVIPMFLFSGTFFPVQQLPAPLRAVAYAHPLVARRRTVPQPRPGAHPARPHSAARRLPGCLGDGGRARRPGHVPAPAGYLI